jgi:hypothetical protein
MEADDCYALMRLWGYQIHHRGTGLIWRHRSGTTQQTPYFEKEAIEDRAYMMMRIARLGGHDMPTSEAAA